MIKDKLITITKENQFDMGWTIFTPYQLPFYKNPRYKPLLVADIVRSITRSDECGHLTVAIFFQILYNICRRLSYLLWYNIIEQ